jgi:hypothetical protein
MTVPTRHEIGREQPERATLHTTGDLTPSERAARERMSRNAGAIFVAVVILAVLVRVLL